MNVKLLPICQKDALRFNEMASRLHIQQTVGAVIRIAVMLGCLAAPLPSQAAHISLMSTQALRFEGTIEKGDFEKLQTLYTSIPKNHLPKLLADIPISRYVMVYGSPGGDVAEALKIGRFLRSNYMSIGLRGPCLSSCALLLSGAISRDIAPSSKQQEVYVGIHRPYLAGNLSAAEAAASSKTMLDAVRAYLSEMGTPVSLAEQMFATPPEHIKILTTEEAAFFWPERDPIFDERRTAAFANYYGVTMEVMRQRNAESEQCLLSNQTLSDQMICAEAILWGLSKSEFLRRNLIVEKSGTCLRQDSQEWAVCKRDVMLGKRAENR